MPTDAIEFIAVLDSDLPMRASLVGTVSGVVVLVWVWIMGGNKTHIIVKNRNINAQTYINDVLAVEALPFIQFHGPNVTYVIMPVHIQPQ